MPRSVTVNVLDLRATLSAEANRRLPCRQRSAMRESNKGDVHGPRSWSFSQSPSQEVCNRARQVQGTDGCGPINESRIRIPTDVSFLRVNYSAVQASLLGVWEIAEQFASGTKTCQVKDELFLTLTRRETMLWTICVIVAILWLLGFSLHVGGGLIHLLLVVA